MESVIAFIDFIKFEDMSEQDKTDLNYLTTFLHRSKKFISPVAVDSRSWGGFMWVIGWRKSSCGGQIVGKYIKKFKVEDMDEFHKHFTQSHKIADIVGRHFKDMANTPFEENQDLMKKKNIPSFASLEFHEEQTDSDFSPHLVFTTDHFYNPPHLDKEDISQFAFVMFIPTVSSDGSLALDPSTYDISSVPFVFPDHKFGINFEHQHGIVKMIWQANQYKHCTMPSTKSSSFTRLGMSAQINSRLANACDRYKAGFYNKPGNYFGGHFYYLFRTAAWASLLLSFFIFLF
jgi:hypothetical protein